ncbi:MAG: hypothetical protein JWL65_143 [Gammaproteobacteria bacterium]|nr:hypothetical protein [Gammaproteobacteria bacterium]
MTNHYRMSVLETMFVADTVENLAAVFREWVDENNYGASDIGALWSVRHAGMDIGKISYNGRYWPNTELATRDETAKAGATVLEHAGVLGRAACAKGIPNAPWLDREFVAALQGRLAGDGRNSQELEAWTAGWTETDLAVQRLNAGPELARKLFAFGVVRLASIYEIASGRDDEIAFLAREGIEHMHRRVAASTMEQLMDDAQGLIRQAALNSVLDALDSGQRAGTSCDLELLRGAEVLVRAAGERAAAALAPADEEGRIKSDLSSTWPTDDDLRALWRAAGGSFVGPDMEAGNMPEAKLLSLLRSLGTGVSQQPPMSVTARVNDRVLRAALRMALNDTPCWREAAESTLAGKPQEWVVVGLRNCGDKPLDDTSGNDPSIDGEAWEP